MEVHLPPHHLTVSVVMFYLQPPGGVVEDILRQLLTICVLLCKSNVLGTLGGHFCTTLVNIPYLVLMRR